jgi:UDP-3-O-acyl-N-acetylglucosamine deacetylase
MLEVPETINSATIALSARIDGRGIFTGQPCSVELQPAPAGSGITFVKDGVRIAAHPRNYIENQFTQKTTAFGIAGSPDNGYVSMTEHLMAALWCAGIDTVDVHCYGPELPNRDGSAALYCETLSQLPLLAHGPRPRLKLSTEVLAVNGHLADASEQPRLAIAPGDGGMLIEYQFMHPELGAATYGADLTRAGAERDIMPARSFVTESEAQQLLAGGMLQHMDDSSALVIRGGVPNSPLLFDNEYARHKVLDLLGDLYCLPFELTGRITAFRSGHALNRALARKLLALLEAQ